MLARKRPEAGEGQKGTISMCTRHARGHRAPTYSAPPLRSRSCSPAAALLRPHCCGGSAGSRGQLLFSDPFQGSAPRFFPTACQTQQGCRQERTKGTAQSRATALTAPDTGD